MDEAGDVAGNERADLDREVQRTRRWPGENCVRGRITIGVLLDGLTLRRTLGGLLVIGWAIYLTVVVASNATDLLVSLGWISTRFHSGNLAFIRTATRIYFRSQPIDQILLGCVLVWEASAAGLLWYGALAWKKGDLRFAAAEAGLLVVTLLWVAFAIVTEAFIAYDRGVNESMFWVLAIASLLTVIVLVQLAKTDHSGSRDRAVPG
ncbi:MAG: hypothetical protein ACTHQQ_02110 [Solirubrobacteraceae bacterium]